MLSRRPFKEAAAKAGASASRPDEFGQRGKRNSDYLGYKVDISFYQYL
jgi:hypothetical protein